MRARSLKDDDDVNYANENFHSPAISISMNLGWGARKHPSTRDEKKSIGGRKKRKRKK